MRNLIILLLFSATFTVRANDTLTRAEVYNFSVGDTFQYRDASYNYSINGHFSPSYSVSFSTCIIRKLYSAPDTPAIVLIREWISYTPSRIDSFKLFSPQDYEVMIDTFGWGYPWHLWTGDTVIANRSTLWWGRHTNYILVHDGYFADGQSYASGFGLVNETKDGGTGVGGSFDDTTTLVYYSGSQGTFGSRQGSYLTPESNITADIQIKVQPNPSFGIFQLMGTKDNDNIEVFNMIGQLIFSGLAGGANSSFDLSSRGHGVYVCRITRDGFSNTLRVVLQ